MRIFASFSFEHANRNKVVPVSCLIKHRAMKMCGRGGCMSVHTILTLAPDGRDWVTVRPLYAKGMISMYRLERKLGGPHSLSGRDGEGKSLLLPGIKLKFYP
jgi:hypothetical protein